MRNVIFFTMIFLFFVKSFNAQTNVETDSLFNINAELCDGIILKKEKIINISDFDEMKVLLKGQNLIKNKEAESLGKFSFRESKFVKVDDIEVVIKDTLGNIIKELNNDDIKYNSISFGSIFYNEHQSVYFNLNHHTYPYIVDYRIKLNYESMFFIPDWYPQKNYPVKQSKLTIRTPKHCQIKWFNVDCDFEPKISGTVNKVYTWDLKNIPERLDESFVAPEDEDRFKILFSPGKFELGKTNGSFNEWKDVAEWFKLLYKDKYTLSPKVKSIIKKLVSDCKTDKDKIQRLYSYLQTKTRYVAIYTDIGGWEPHKCADIFKNGYGDCKDLTTLMISMLKEVGIKSYPAFVRTRSNGIVYEKFPCNQFNHVVAFVPLKNDTLWLECTSDYLNFDEISASIENTKALVANENPQIITIPTSKAIENQWKSLTEVELVKEGIKINSQIKLTGNQKKYQYSALMTRKNEDQLILIKKMFNNHWGEFYLTNFDFNNTTNNDTLILNIEGLYKSHKSILKKRVFIQPSLFNVKSTLSLVDNEKTTPFYFRYPYNDFDKIRIKIPKNYKVEKLAKTYKMSSEFADYKSSCAVKGDYIEFSREYILNKNIFPAELEKDYTSLVKGRIKVDKSKIVLKRNSLF